MGKKVKAKEIIKKLAIKWLETVLRQYKKILWFRRWWSCCNQLA
jgi:hypothetical protein